MSSAGDSTASNQTFGQDASVKLPHFIGAMSISPSGRDVVLGSKEGLHVIDLDSLHSPPRELPHRTPWEVADVQWSPFAERDYWVASTSNQKALVWNLAAYDQRNYIEHVLHGHSRAITDINFSAWSPDKLATCAVDSFVHCWDLRCPARPVTSFSDWFAGATQVKWSRQDEHVIASSHDKFLHIWDDRFGAYPTRTFEAHDAKIYGIDWNRFEPSKIVTCSLDKTVKFWDTKNEENLPDRVIQTSFPVWRARHTPFGWGLMVMPQRGDGDLHLYDRRAVNGVYESGHVEPARVFKGHKGQCREFLWRSTGTVVDGIDHRDFQLLSWGADCDLKLHAVSKNVFMDVGYEKGVSKPQNLRFTRRGAKYRTFHAEPTESDAAAIFRSRHDSLPAHSQFLRARGRPSTNVGMSTVPAIHFKGWLQAGKRERRTDMHGKGIARPNTDPISWMKNVKMADALADEITQVGERFKKVDFESINMSQRRATMSLQSPWGEPGSSSVYTRIDMKFPKSYPKNAQAVMYVARTNSISSETQKKLASDIHQIAEIHASKGRGCIEAVVRFLLKEQTLEQVISWMTRDSLTDSKILDGTNIAQDASDDSDDDQLDSIPNIANSSANVRAPIPKGCAGLWAENGKLVCFFIPREKEPASFLSTLGTGKLDDSESSKLFGGFGKFQVDSPSRKVKDAPNTVNDDSDSESSGQSSLFSSSISSSDSSEGFEERARFVPWQRTTLDSLQRGRSADGSQKSTIMDGARVEEPKKPPVVSIWDLSDILPAKQSLARDYKVCGDILEVCQHNAEVSNCNALYEHAMLWRLVANVLVPGTSQQLGRSAQEDADLSALLGRLTSTLKSKQALRSFDSATSVLDPSQPNIAEGVFGQAYLVPAIMRYLDQLCDIQMLAMLSAVFLQSKAIQLDIISKFPIQVRHGSNAIASSTDDDADTLNLGPSEGHFGGLRHSATFNVQDYQLERKDQSLDGIPEMSTSVPTSTMHTGFLDSTHSSSGAPSVIAHDPSGFVSAIHSTVVSLAGSPESHRPSRRSEGSLAFPNATASLHALTRSRPASPPSQNADRERSQQYRSSKALRASPDENFFNDARSRLRLKSSMSLVNVSAYDNDASGWRNGSQRPRPILKNGKPSRSKQQPKRKLRTRFLDPSLTKPEPGPPVTELVGTARDCLSYIQQYVHFLDIWQLWSQKAEMQQILSRATNILDKIDYGRSSTLSRVEPIRGLEIRRCCPTCGQAFAAIEKNGIAIGWHCVSPVCTTRGSRSTRRQVCSICDIAVSGLSIPCLECGHLTCYECAQGWFISNPVEDRKDSTGSFNSISNEHERTREEMSCPTGCGCSCPTLTTITVPNPTISTRSEQKANTTPTTPHSEGYQETPSRASAVAEHRPHRGQSVHTPEGAVNALLALNLSSRHRSLSSAQGSATPTFTTSQGASGPRGTGLRTRENSVSVSEELIPWETVENPSLGRGMGGGLSRGLSNKGSDATIRKSGR